MALTPATFTIAEVDTSCLDLTVSGAGITSDPFVLTAAVLANGAIECTVDGVSLKLSADANNAAVLGTDDGLYIEAPGTTVVGSTSIDAGISGSGVASDPFAITVDTIVSSTAGNTLVDSANGLYVPARVGVFELGVGCDLEVRQYVETGFTAPRNLKIVGASWFIGTGPDGANVAVSVLVNGVPTDSFVVNNGAADASGALEVFSPAITLNAGDVVILHVTQIGSVNPGSHLYVFFDYELV